jgi:hypothetical protein
MSLGEQLLQSKFLDNDADGASSADGASIRSNRSSRADPFSDDFADDGFGDDSFDDFESKMLENLNLIAEKSARTRCEALLFLKSGLASRQLSYFVNDRQATLMDAVERSLKKGKSDEQQNALLLAALVFITLGSTDRMDALFKQLLPSLLASLQDNSLAAPVRSQCAVVASIGCFIAPNGADHIESIMQVLYALFSGSFLKGNGIVPTLTPQTAGLHCNSLAAWTLLLTVCSNEGVLELADKSLPKIAQLLESSDLEVRLAAGECIALFNEIAHESGRELNSEQLDELCDRLLQMTKDCQKFRAKKDLKVQRSSFRDILKSVEDGQAPHSIVRFGREILKLDSWRKRIQYEMLCNVMGTGINAHLASNELFRDIFELGPEMPEENLQRKALHNIRVGFALLFFCSWTIDLIFDLFFLIANGKCFGD